jgi:hypothetical protein
MQADSLAAMKRTYVYQMDSLWTPVARELAGLPRDYDRSAALDRYQRARRAQVDLLLNLAPAVMEFDREGNLLQAWGGPGPGYDWPANEHGIFVDPAGNVWLAGNGRRTTRSSSSPATAGS